MTTRTSVALEKFGPLLDGHHENPFEVLGPHEIVAAGRRAMAVRAFLPDSAQAWIIDAQHSQPQPIRRIHPPRLYHAICPLTTNAPNPPYPLPLPLHPVPYT